MSKESSEKSNQSNYLQHVPVDPEFGESQGAHYQTTKIQPIDVIDDWDLGFNLGNAVKYIGRAGKKIPAGKTAEEAYLSDISKAYDYIKRELDKLRK